MKRAGFDWLWIDGEHAAHSYETVRIAVQCAEDVGLISFFRVAQLEYPRIAQALDMGVSGIIIPRVETADQVRMAVECAKYPPVGKRGFGMRPSLFGVNHTTMNERIADQQGRFLCIQIETPLGADNIEKLLDAGAGQLDAVFFGYADFQMALGRPDSPNDPELVDAIRRVAEACALRGISTGTPINNVEEARLWRSRGYNLLTYLNDDAFMSLYAERCREAVRDVT